MSSGPRIQAPQPPPVITFPPMPNIEFPEISYPEPYDPEAAATKERRAQEVKTLRQIELKRKGYAATLLTPNEDQTQPPLKRPGLLAAG